MLILKGLSCGGTFPTLEYRMPTRVTKVHPPVSRSCQRQFDPPVGRVTSGPVLLM